VSATSVAAVEAPASAAILATAPAAEGSALADVYALAAEIGPRGTGTEGEAAAATYVSGRLTAFGLPVSTRAFRAVQSQNVFPLGSDVLALIAVVVNVVGGRSGRWVAAALALAAGPLLWRAIRLSTNPLRVLLPQVDSGNVVARAAPRAAVRRRVVILAHLDTNRCRLAWRSGTVRWLEPLTWLTLGMFGVLGLLFSAGAVFADSDYPQGDYSWLWLLSLVPTAYILGTLVTLIRDDRTPFSPGAHDNAASVAVALRVAAGLTELPLQNTEVWLAFTGAEETDHAGLYALLHDDPTGLRDADFIGLEGLGSGRLTYLTQEGLCQHLGPDPGLLATAARVAAGGPELDAAPARMTVEDEVCTLRRLGYRAICIAGCDPVSGTLPHWHRSDDTADTVSGEFMERAALYVRALLDDLDRAADVPDQSGEGAACARL